MQHLPQRLQTGFMHVYPYFLREIPNAAPATAPITKDVNAKTCPLCPQFHA